MIPDETKSYIEKLVNFTVNEKCKDLISTITKQSKEISILKTEIEILKQGGNI